MKLPCKAKLALGYVDKNVVLSSEHLWEPVLRHTEFASLDLVLNLEHLYVQANEPVVFDPIQLTWLGKHSDRTNAYIIQIGTEQQRFGLTPVMNTTGLDKAKLTISLHSFSFKVHEFEKMFPKAHLAMMKKYTKMLEARQTAKAAK